MAKTKAVKQSTPCPVSKEQFKTHAKPLLVNIDSHSLVASPKEFSTGSIGWFAGEKIVVMIDGVPVKVQVGINLTVVGSKGGVS